MPTPSAAFAGFITRATSRSKHLQDKVGGMDLRDQVVSYSSGFYKVEINQINALLAKLTAEGR